MRCYIEYYDDQRMVFGEGRSIEESQENGCWIRSDTVIEVRQ